MPNTPRGIPYPSSTGHTRLWEHLQALADKVDSLLGDGSVSGARIGRALEDTDSASFTAETAIATLTVPLVSGRLYWIRLVTRLGTDVTGTTATVRVREDSVAGNELIGDIMPWGMSSSNAGNLWIVEGEYTAAATGTKTFVATAARAAGTGVVRREAGANHPTILTVGVA